MESLHSANQVTADGGRARQARISEDALKTDTRTVGTRQEPKEPEVEVMALQSPMKVGTVG